MSRSSRLDNLVVAKKLTAKDIYTCNLVVDGNQCVQGEANFATNVNVSGKLSVDGLIDPTGLILTGQDTEPATVATNDGMVWVDKTISPTRLCYTDDSNTTTIISDVGSLPAPLQSIANLTTAGNELIYTTASNTYATTPVSGAGRSFVSAQTAAEQQTALNLVPGVNVQPQSSILDTVNTIAATGGQMLYTVGGNYSNTPVSAFARGNVLTATSSASLVAGLDIVQGPVSTADRLVKISGTNMVTETGITVDAFNSVSGVNDLAVDGDVTIVGNLDGITPTERSQLANINGTTITTTQWGYLGNMNQNVASSNSPTFGGLNLSGNLAMGNNFITGLAGPPVANTDAVNKAYVDALAGAGLTPLPAVQIATVANLAGYGGNTITGVDAQTAGSIDMLGGVYSWTVGDRVLVKNQSDPVENGIYSYSAAAAGTLTRVSGFDTGDAVSMNTFVFVESGDTLGGSQWIVGADVASVGTDPVVWEQFGGSQPLMDGNGIDISGGVVSVDLVGASPLTFTGGQLDLGTVDVGHGGTGQTTLTNGGVLVGQGAAAVDSSKAAPSGDFVGTSDSQALTNKTLTSATNNVTARSLFCNSGANTVSVFSSAVPSAGDVLTAIDATSAEWTTPSAAAFEPSRTLFVFGGASNVSPNWSTLGAALTDASSMTPTAASPVIIFMYPGRYTESTPLTIPQHVTISGMTAAQSSVIIRPTAPAPAAAVMVAEGNARLFGFIIEGSDGAGANATIGVHSQYGAVNQGLDVASSVTVRNCSLAGFRVTGNTTQFSRIQLCKQCSVQVTQVGFTCVTGYDVEQGGLLRGLDLNVSGFFVSGFAGTITNGFYVRDDFSYADLNVIQPSFCTNGVRVGGAVSNSQGHYPTFRGVSAIVGRASDYGLLMEAKSVCRVSDFTVEDNTGEYPDQIHLRIESPSLPANPNFLTSLWLNIRQDLIEFGGAGAVTNPPEIQGLNLSEIPGEIQNIFQGELVVGRADHGFESAFGEGDSRRIGLAVLVDDGGVFTDYSTIAKNITTNPIAVNLATTASIDLTSAPATVDGVAPTAGVSRILVKDGSTANPGILSVDNGIYIWNGAGVAMTRSSDFAAGSEFTDKTYFAVDVGVVNYGSRWKLLGEDGLGNNVSNIVVGTNPIEVTSLTFQALPAAPVNGDALYIGSASPLVIPFSGIKLRLTKPITTISGTSRTVVTWEYWNGSSWTSLRLMSTLSTNPYTHYNNLTMGYSDTITSPNSRSYQYRFGDISSTWSSSTINGTLAYWVRMRVIDAANISQVPVISQIKLHTNRSEINEDGFVEFYGVARQRKLQHITLRSLTPTGTSGETAPGTQRLVVSNTPNTIATERPNCLYANNIVTAAAFGWSPPVNIDTSSDLVVSFEFSRHQSSSGNVALQLDAVFVTNDDVIGNPNGSPTAVGQTTGVVAFPVSTVARGVFTASLSVNISQLNPNSQTIWFKISRLGAHASDTYNSDIYMMNLDLNYVQWSLGNTYNS